MTGVGEGAVFDISMVWVPCDLLFGYSHTHPGERRERKKESVEEERLDVKGEQKNRGRPPSFHNGCA